MIVAPEQRLARLYRSFEYAYAMGHGCSMSGGTAQERRLREEVRELEELVAERGRVVTAHYVVEHGSPTRTLCGAAVRGVAPRPTAERCWSASTCWSPERHRRHVAPSDGMRVLVTGSAGHLGEALARVLHADGDDVVGLDVLHSPFTSVVGSIADRDVARRCVEGADAILHAATLHKPHVGSHDRQAFVDTNVTGTLTLLEAAVDAGVGRFVFTSTTSTFGRALTPPPGAPAAWITEDVVPLPRNVYGATKTAAEDLCELVHRDHGLPCLILRTSRFFPEPDDRDEVRAVYDDANLKVNELLYRRVDLEDVVSAHRLALERAPEIGFGRYIVTATTPFTSDDLAELRTDAPAVVRRRVPEYEAVYAARGWTMLEAIERVYVNARARRELGWTPGYDFRHVLDRLAAGEDPRSPLAVAVGAKGYHAQSTGPYTVR